MDTGGSGLFGDAGGAYRLYRPAYPAALFEEILARLVPPYTSVLDLGAGTGLSTKVLAAHFTSVTAAEPDAKMLAEASFGPGMTILQKSAEELDLPDESVQLVTCGNAFYWMDGPRLAAAIHRWLAKGGLFAAYRYEMPTTDSEQANRAIWWESELHWDAFRHERLRDGGYTLRTLRESGSFPIIETLHIENRVKMPPEGLAGFFASTSYGGAYLATLPDADAYLAALAGELGGPGDVLDVDFGLELVLAHK